MSRKFSDLTAKELARLPSLCFDHSRIGEEIIHLHLFNDEKMHWYIVGANKQEVLWLLFE